MRALASPSGHLIGDIDSKPEDCAPIESEFYCNVELPVHIEVFDCLPSLVAEYDLGPCGPPPGPIFACD